jgi:hypothetical protein
MEIPLILWRLINAVIIGWKNRRFNIEKMMQKDARSDSLKMVWRSFYQSFQQNGKLTWLKLWFSIIA